MAKHEIAMIRLGSTDLDRTRLFYQNLFDWEMNTLSVDVLGFSTPSGLGGSFIRLPTVTPGNSVLLSVEVSEFEIYTTKIAELGGNVSDSVVEIPDYGSSLPITDPDGNLLSLWRPA